MITVDSLLALAVQQDEIAASMRTRNSYDARLLRDRALRAAEQMEAQGIKETRHIGQFDSRSFSVGQKVRLRRGAIVRSMNPQIPREGKPNGVTRTIEIKYFTEGYTDIMGGYPAADRNTQINWAGTGSYWCWVDANDVELIDA